jgi:hypothetical protein
MGVSRALWVPLKHDFLWFSVVGGSARTGPFFFFTEFTTSKERTIWLEYSVVDINI